MAKLNQSLIISMSQELQDLHEIGEEMTEYIGGCQIVSWRFPLKQITDVHIDPEQKFNTDEKYIFLLELIIDRLYLIVNLTLEMINTLPELTQKSKMPKNVIRPAELSFGTLISLFWKRLKFLMKSKSIQFSSKSKSESLSSAVTAVSTLSSRTEISCAPSPSPCTSCETALNSVKSLIKEVEQCMKILQISSAITKCRQEKEKDLLNLSQASAMQKWSECIIEDIHNITLQAKNLSKSCYDLNKDIDKITKETTDNILKLQENQIKLASVETANEEIVTKLQRELQENDQLRSQLKNMTNDLRESQNKNIKNDEKIRELEDQVREFTNKLQDIITNIEQNEKELQSVTSEKNYWQDISKETKAKVEELENKIKYLENTINELQEKLSTELQNKEEKIHLETENEKLLAQIDELNSKIISKEQEYETGIQLLKKENSSLQEQISCGKEREIMLVRCPDLNGPIYTKVKNNPLDDMEEQLKSNEIRIALLQEQNVNLQRTIDKIMRLKDSSRILNK